MKIKYTRHARERMRARNIRDIDVIKAIEKPDSVCVETDRKNIKIFQRLLNSGVFLLRVVVAVAAIPYVIITAYKTNDVNRYHPPKT